MQSAATTIAIPPWLPPQLHDGYREIAAERGEEEAAAWGRQAKRGRTLEWTPGQIEHLRRRFADSASAATIAVEIGFGATRNAVIGKLHRLGLRRHGEIAAVPEPPFDWTEPRIAMLRRLWDRDVPSREIAAKIGTSAGSARDKAARLGLTPRASGALRVARGLGGQAPAGRRPADGARALVPAPVAAITTAIPKCEPGNGVLIHDLEHHHCRWPMIEVPAGRGDGMRYCGAERVERVSHGKLALSPHCAAHAETAYGPAAPRTEAQKRGDAQRRAALIRRHAAGGSAR